jgi:hypothetical protein
MRRLRFALQAVLCVLSLIAILAALICVVYLTSEVRADMTPIAEFGLAVHDAPPDKLWHQTKGGYKTSMNRGATYTRVGLDVAGVRFFGFDANGINIDAIGNNNEECVEANGANASKVCPSDQRNRFVTMSAARGIGLGYVFEYREFYLEIAATRVERELTVAVADGVAPFNNVRNIFSETQSGPGFMVGGGYRTRNIDIRFFAYDDSVGARFNNGATPAGTHLAMGVNGVVVF